jgi:hypothetical protein
MGTAGAASGPLPTSCANAPGASRVRPITGISARGATRLERLINAPLPGTLFTPCSAPIHRSRGRENCRQETNSKLWSKFGGHVTGSSGIPANCGKMGVSSAAAYTQARAGGLEGGGLEGPGE